MNAEITALAVEMFGDWYTPSEWDAAAEAWSDGRRATPNPLTEGWASIAQKRWKR